MAGATNSQGGKKDPAADGGLSLIKERDDLLIDHLELLESYLKSTLDEERLLKEGFINIAHARMCMKPNIITLDGFPHDTTEDFEAPSRVISVEKEEEDEEDCRLISLEIDSAKDPELRRLLGRSAPAGLKTSQGLFHRVLERSIERANILYRLTKIEKRRAELDSEIKVLQQGDENVVKLEKLSVGSS